MSISLFVSFVLIIDIAEGFSYAPCMLQTPLMRSVRSRAEFRFRTYHHPAILVTVSSVENAKFSPSILHNNIRNHRRLISDGISKNVDTRGSPFSAELLTHIAATIAFVALILGRSAMFMLASLFFSALLASTFTVMAWQVISYLFLSGDLKVCAHRPRLRLNLHDNGCFHLSFWGGVCKRHYLMTWTEKFPLDQR